MILQYIIFFYGKVISDFLLFSYYFSLKPKENHSKHKNLCVKHIKNNQKDLRRMFPSKQIVWVGCLKRKHSFHHHSKHHLKTFDIIITANLHILHKEFLWIISLLIEINLSTKIKAEISTVLEALTFLINKIFNFYNFTYFF